MCSFYFSSKVCNTPSLLVYFLWFLALRGKTLNHTAHWLLQNASSPDNEGVSEIWIAYKPRAVVVWAWWVKGVSSEMNTVKGGLREATAPLAFGLTMIHEDGCLRICADHMKGSDSGWAGKWLLLGAPWKSFDAKSTIFILILSEESSGKFSSTQVLTRSDAQCSGWFSVKIRVQGICQLRWLPDPSLCVFKHWKPDFSKEEIWRSNSLPQSNVPLRTISQRQFSSIIIVI